MDSIAIRQRLDALITSRGEDYASLSRRLGRNASYIQQFIKRGVPRRLSESDRRILAQHFGIAEHLLGGPTDRGHTLLPRPGLARAAEDYVLIPQYQVRASAGPGALPDGERPSAAIAFQAGFIRDIAPGAPDQLAILSVDGDSMFPTLANGDQILIDTADRTPSRDGIYVLRVDDALMVKRLSLNPATRRLTIRSDNEAYPSWPDCDPTAVHIIGRVVWVGRKLG
ncbi:peptidase S24 [Sandarakinorhabdus cyanobacteriorum]|uniref:Peptidase S24 n=1 Tax=Sandarakinorhabdus cyanobacteriorum TaxID=1981098 RepID=A0A255Y5Y1_9SPHN|nr:S24 family peptidase [Sandarakinorhabdus cyanobacteriorum]OYQ24667.1 peptidase S24 [Sandarakinorhabdus cyanobacteriorum]